MTNTKKARWAHDVLDGLFAGRILSRENEQLLRSFLPERPKQKTLTELRHEVWDAWVGTEGSEWPDDVFGDLETWLHELHTQIQELEHDAKPAKPAHPEFLDTAADYATAPDGTIVAPPGRLAWVKEGANDWTCGSGANGDYSMAQSDRGIVLRWGWGK